MGLCGYAMNSSMQHTSTLLTVNEDVDDPRYLGSLPQPTTMSFPGATEHTRLGECRVSYSFLLFNICIVNMITISIAIIITCK